MAIKPDKAKKRMGRKPPEIEIEEVGGEKYKSLQEAQADALPLLGQNLVKVISGLMEKGCLTKVDGGIIPQSSNKEDQDD